MPYTNEQLDKIGEKTLQILKDSEQGSSIEDCNKAIDQLEKEHNDLTALEMCYLLKYLEERGYDLSTIGINK